MDCYLLFESASGYGLFLRKEFDELAQADMAEAVQQAAEDPKAFSKMVKQVAFHPFATAEEALSEIQSVANGECSETLSTFLEMHLTKVKKSKRDSATYRLGVFDTKLGEALNEQGFVATYSQSIKELLRGCRIHLAKMMKTVTEKDLDRARCGLSHAFSRTKMQFDPNRQDKPIMNASAILDGLDKNINTFAMRVREWYSWHFPELAKITTDNTVYAKVAKLIRIKEEFNWEENMAALAELCGSEDVAEEITRAAKHSMGTEIVEMDMVNIDHFADQVIKLAEMRTNLQTYLKDKMNIVAPNLTALIGETVGARLISHAGSLTSLAKYPASTIQILGAEKALFRALKTKGNTPKYGLIFHSSFIGRAQQKNKGRISRYLANKCSLASRIDCFADGSSTTFGEKMHAQVEERLTYLTTGEKPRRNIEVMREAKAEVDAIAAKKAKKDKKRKSEVVEEEAPIVEEEAPRKKSKKSKKDE